MGHNLWSGEERSASSNINWLNMFFFSSGNGASKRPAIALSHKAENVSRSQSIAKSSSKFPRFLTSSFLYQCRKIIRVQINSWATTNVNRFHMMYNRWMLVMTSICELTCIVVVLVSLSKLDRNLRKLALRNPAVSMNVSARLSNKSCCELNEHLETIVCRKILFPKSFAQIVWSQTKLYVKKLHRNNYAMNNRHRKDLKISKFPYSEISIKFCLLLIWRHFRCQVSSDRE